LFATSLMFIFLFDSVIGKLSFFKDKQSAQTVSNSI
jgi:hypothetical protein